MTKKDCYRRIFLLSVGLVCTLLTAFTLALRSELTHWPERLEVPVVASVPAPAEPEQDGAEMEQEGAEPEKGGGEPGQGGVEPGQSAPPDGENAVETLSSRENAESLEERPSGSKAESRPKEESRPGRPASSRHEERPSSVEEAPESSKPPVSSRPAVSQPASREESAPVSSQLDLAALRKENDRRAAALSRRTGIPVMILREKGPEADPADEAAASSAISLAEDAFEGYGNGLLKKEIGKFVLAGSLPTGDGLCFEGTTLFADCRTFRHGELREALYRRTESLLLWDGVPELSDFNPENFHYGLPREEYVWAGSPIEASFFSLKGQVSVRADFCEVFRKAMEDPVALTELPEGCPLWKKARFCCEVFAERLPELRENYAIAYFTGG